MVTRQPGVEIPPMAQRKPIDIAIVEDDRRVRESLEAILTTTDSCRLAGSCRTGEQALRELPKTPAKVVIVDINLPDMSGVELIRQLREITGTTQFLVLTVYRDTDTILEALTAGAVGYLVKPVTPARLIDAVEDVASGGAPMTGAVARKVVQVFSAAGMPTAAVDATLTPREREVLDMLAQGFSKKQIAARLGVSFSTVRTHLEHVYKKLHARSQAQAVATWMKRRWKPG
jgi:DNA-binding NarL/FixJ family response regulator